MENKTSSAHEMGCNYRYNYTPGNTKSRIRALEIASRDIFAAHANGNASPSAVSRAIRMKRLANKLTQNIESPSPSVLNGL